MIINIDADYEKKLSAIAKDKSMSIPELIKDMIDSYLDENIFDIVSGESK